MFQTSLTRKVRLIEIFWSQHSKLYLKANAIKGLAEYRALQSRLNTSTNHVEAFEVLEALSDKGLGAGAGARSRDYRRSQIKPST